MRTGRGTPVVKRGAQERDGHLRGRTPARLVTILLIPATILAVTALALGDIGANIIAVTTDAVGDTGAQQDEDGAGVPAGTQAPVPSEPSPWAPLLPVAACFLGGAGLALALSRTQWAAGSTFRLLVRTQILATASVLGLLSAWRLDSLTGLLQPALIQAVTVVILAASLIARGRRTAGESALEAWSAVPNMGFWVTPLAAALAGPEGVALVVLSDRIGAPVASLKLHLLRKDAPRPQTRATALVDHSPTIALLVGLAASMVAPAPEWTGDALGLAGPVLAFTGAFLYTSSLTGPQRNGSTSGENLERSAPSGRTATLPRWASLVAVRTGYIAAVAVLLDEPVLLTLAPLVALSAPAFNPPQLARLYGYSTDAARAASYAGWALAPLGLAAAMLLTTRL